MTVAESIWAGEHDVNGGCNSAVDGNAANDWSNSGKENSDTDDAMALKANTAMRERRAVEATGGGVKRAAVELVIWTAVAAVMTPRTMSTARGFNYPESEVFVCVNQQISDAACSGRIDKNVRDVGAGDQGIMIGHGSNESDGGYDGERIDYDTVLERTP